MNSLAPLNKKQAGYLQRTTSSWFNVLEGGKRGGKNVTNALAFCLALEQHPNKLHLVAGVSIANAMVNILECDGYGILNFFDGRYRIGEYSKKTCVYVKTITGEKVLIVAGGGKNGDEKYIKGNTYGMAYVTEANECAELFLKEVFDRTMSSDNRKVFHDLNPKAPNHWYYTQILDFHAKQQLANPQYGYNYGHVTISDNMSISDDKLRQVLSTYEKGTVWYDRDIKGIRKQAEGLVFPTFANNPDAWCIDKSKLQGKSFEWVEAGFDIGGNKSAYAFTITAKGFDDVYYCLYSKKTQASDLDMAEVENIVNEGLNVLRVHFKVQTIDYINTDHVDVIINHLNRNTIHQAGKTYKPPLEDRPFVFSMLFSSNRFLFVKEFCTDAITELQNIVYNPKEERAIVLDDGTMQIDTWDSLVYSIAGDWTNAVERNER